jgi:hypothetical protein
MADSISYLTSDNYTEFTDTTGDLQNWVGGEYKGQVLINQTNQDDMSFGQLCFRSDESNWYLASANVANIQSTSMLGICVKNALVGEGTEILTSGYVVIDGLYIAIGDNGNPLFMSVNSGEMTYLQPSSSGNVVRIIGYTFWNQGTQLNGLNIIYFNPDNTWIELT